MLPGVAHDVTPRGNNRQDVFFVEDDRRVYLSYLRESAERYGMTVSAHLSGDEPPERAVLQERMRSSARRNNCPDDVSARSPSAANKVGARAKVNPRPWDWR